MINKVERILNKKLIVFGVIAALALIVYCNCFSAPFMLDDFGNIKNNYSIRNPLDILSMWKFYSNRVIVYITFAIDYKIHDNGVEGYRVVNILIHMTNGFLVFLIFYYILGLGCLKEKLLIKYRNIISILAALIFVCHPIQVNSVTYIVQRTASLASMFYLLAVLFFLKFRIFDKKRYFLLVMLFTVMAMLTKENTFTIPFLLLIIELMFFLKDGKTSWKKRLLFLFIIFLTTPIAPGILLFLKGYSQSDPNVAFKASTSMDRMTYFYTELNVIILYIKLLFVPDRQNFDYSNDFPKSEHIWQNYSYVSFSVLLILGIIALLNVRKNKLLSFGIIWFFIGLSVESSFLSIKDVYFEHRLYFPLVGFIMSLVGISFIEFKKYRRLYLFKKPFLFFMILSITMIISYSILTLKRNYIYSDNIRLWTDVIKKAPNSDRGHATLGTQYLDKVGDPNKNKYELDMAEKEFNTAIRLNKFNSTAHCNLSRVYFLEKQYNECISEAYVALNLDNDSVYAYNNIGNAYEGLGNDNKAIEAFLKGYNKDKKFLTILENLGDVYTKINDFKNAKFYYEEYMKNSKSSVIKKKLDKIKNK
jgi:protein O-mannosyl-transferase